MPSWLSAKWMLSRHIAFLYTRSIVAGPPADSQRWASSFNMTSRSVDAYMCGSSLLNNTEDQLSGLKGWINFARVRDDRFHLVFLHMILEVPISSKNSRCLLVIQDYYTKWPEAIPLPDQKEVTITKLMSLSRCYPDLAYQRFYPLIKDVILKALFWLKSRMHLALLSPMQLPTIGCLFQQLENWTHDGKGTGSSCLSSLLSMLR